MRAEQPLISAVIITLNEEKNIGRCIDSLKGVVDEIIVVDSGSSDNTASICAAKDVKFVFNKWQGYSAQKNFANSLASNSLVLSIDADEALSPELRISLQNISEQAGITAWEMNRRTNYCGKWINHCGWYPDRKLRLFYKDLGQWDGAKMHEHIVMTSGETAFLKGDLLHYSYYSLSDHVKQIELFSGLMAEMNFETGKKASLLKLFFSIPARFIRDYFFRLGLLDGYYGFVICSLSAWASFIKYLKLRELNKHL